MDIIVDISKELQKQIDNIFKKESIIVLKLLKSLKEHPQKGKIVGKFEELLIKELKYKSFRFYFITNGRILKLLLKGELVELIIKFVKMSKKNNQQEIINEVKKILQHLKNN